MANCAISNRTANITRFLHRLNEIVVEFHLENTSTFHKSNTELKMKFWSWKTDKVFSYKMYSNNLYLQLDQIIHVNSGCTQGVNM